MNTIGKLKLAIYEAANENLIDKETSETMLSFCESADIDNVEDRKTLMEMTENLITATESANEPVAESPEPEVVVEESATSEETQFERPSETSVKLAIFESEACGDITSEERDALLSLL